MSRDFKVRPTVNGAGVLLQGEGITVVTLAADVANVNATANTFQNVTGLSANVAAGINYRFRFFVIYDAAALTPGSRWAVSGPATPTLLAYKARWTSTGAADVLTNANAYDAGTVSAASQFTTGNLAIIEGIIRPSAAGVLVARFASEVASSAITARAGSTLEIF